MLGLCHVRKLGQTLTPLRETTCFRELKNTTPKRINPKYNYEKKTNKKTMIHRPKVDLQEIIRERERERIIIFLRENVRDNNKFIENYMRRKSVN